MDDDEYIIDISSLSTDTLEHLKVEYFTNGMHSKRVHFTVSIDGYGSLNEQVRSNSIWHTVEKNLNQIADTFDHTVRTTIHKNNWGLN